MFKDIIFCLSCLMLVTPVMAEKTGDCFIEVEFYKIVADEYINLGASGTGQCSSYNGMFYIKEKESGIQGGIINENENTFFEVIYSLRIREVREQKLLYGVIYCINFDESGSIVSGEKTLLDQPVLADKQEKIEIGLLPDGSRVAIGITLLNKKPQQQESTAAITVKTSEREMAVVNNKYALAEKTQFSTGTGLLIDGKISQLKYIMDITIADIPDSFVEPIKTTLTFKRRYWIDRDYYSDKKFTKDVEYTSTYSRKIELIPGRTMILVFPPDTPSVQGFDITDTLIIRP